MSALSYLLAEEKRHQGSFSHAIGIDEAGRGPLGKFHIDNHNHNHNNQ
jgi:hypothetical protein